MGKSTKKWIDKKQATTFHLVHRPQTDPLVHDPDAPQMVFKTIYTPENDPKRASRRGDDEQEGVASSSRASVSSTSGSKIKTTKDLEAELGDEVRNIRKNEGEAAQYGIYYDDTEYDYMQHLRDFGTLGDAVLIEAPASKGKGKKKESLDQALRAVPPPDSLLPADILPNANKQRKTYQDMQDVPDAIAGFQPDMDPRLREALEALEDEEFVTGDDDMDDIFGELTKSGEVNDVYEIEGGDEDEDYGYESDATARPASPAPKESDGTAVVEKQDGEGQGDWMREFSKYKKDVRRQKEADADLSSVGGDSLMSFGAQSNFSISSRRRRRKGRSARTESSGYSMTSSSLLRTEGLTLLDSRFDKIEEEYNEDSDDDGYDGLGIDSAPRNAPPVVSTRKDFDNIMDEFLEGYSTTGKTGRRRVRKGKQQSGMEQLDEIRMGLKAL